MSLCDACARIDPDIFSPALDNAEFMQGPPVLHLPVAWIRKSAHAGCPLCSCLIESAQVDWLPRTILETKQVILRRATIDSQQALALFVDMDDVSHTYFFRIPPIWWHLPLAELGEPCRHVDLMSFWIKDCIQSHPQCSSNAAKNFVPTRLLDVRAFQASKDIRLVMLDGKSATPKYVALSHCWGPPSNDRLTTTMNNLAQHSQCISFSNLPLTFQDAVKLTLDLGQRYLWIDSLCIVQGDDEDWLREVSKMASVYGNALVTLSALSSADSTHGCRVLNPRASTHDHRFCDFDLGPHRIRVFQREIREWHEEYGDDTYRHGEHGENPLRRRAWALQERELSTRNIHFSQNLVLWQCKTLKASCELPWHEVKPMDDFQPWPMRNSAEESLEPGGPVLVRDRWYELMEDYMSRLLTKGTDKLPALSGLAQSFQSQLPSSRYLAGLWTGHLPYALLWRMGSLYTSSNAQQPLSFRAPSWSFLSLDGAMSYESQRLDNSGGPRPGEATTDCGHADLIVLDTHAQPSGADQYLSLIHIFHSLR